MRQSVVLAGVCGAIAVVCLGAGLLFFVERPTVLKVAVPSDNRSDVNLLNAAGKVVRHGHQPVRFKVYPVENTTVAAEKLDDASVDMAVVRTDGAMPAEGQTVVILHRDAAILVAPGGSDLKEIKDLAGHTVGIVEDGPTNQSLLETALAQYDVEKAAVKTVALTPETVGEAIKAGQVDAVLVVGIVSGAKVLDTVRAVSHAIGKPPSFIPIAEAAAIAQRSSAYDSFEVVKGAFRGAPPLPGDEFDTLSVTHRLVARSTLSASVVADVTRFFLAERSALVAVDPIARRIEAPSTDKGAALPAHEGTSEYIDDEEETFLDQYSDFIYLGAMFFGVLASGGTAIFTRLNAQSMRAVERLTCRLVEILKLVRFAPTVDLVNALETETDEIVATALDLDTARGLDERRLGTLGLALDQVREAIRDRRALLSGTPERAAEPPEEHRSQLRIIPAE